PSTADELRWYFEARRHFEEQPQPGARDAGDQARYARARDAFGAPRYRVLYRSWLREGAPAFRQLVTSVLADAISRGTGRLEIQVLPHPYLHLAPLVASG